jgi:cytochrome c oxidase subunit 4
MPERILSPLTYLIVYGILIALTLLTVGISFIHLSEIGHIVLGALIGLCKASLVILFFMHALSSPRLTWVVIGVAIFWLGILLVLTLSDYVTRGLVPHMPGH